MARSKRSGATRVANTPEVLPRPQERVLQAEDLDRRSYFSGTLPGPLSGPAVYIAPVVRRRLLASPRRQAVFSGLPRRHLPPMSTRQLRRPVWYRAGAFFCLRRQQRKEVMFAKRVAGRRGITRYRRNLYSQYGC